MPYWPNTFRLRWFPGSYWLKNASANKKEKKSHDFPVNSSILRDFGYVPPFRSQQTMSFSCTCHRTRIVSVGFVTKPSINDGATGSQWTSSYLRFKTRCPWSKWIYRFRSYTVPTVAGVLEPQRYMYNHAFHMQNPILKKLEDLFQHQCGISATSTVWKRGL